MSKRKLGRCWSKSIGQRGHRVRLYEARPGGPIMRSVYVNGKEDRKSLGHRDRKGDYNLYLTSARKPVIF